VDGEVARIMAFVVGFEERGQGVGRTMISTIEDWARQREAAEIMLTTHERRAGAHEFYRRMGYDRTGHRFYIAL
jgi:GNAT superfamily N-acetyltransferase